MVSKKKTMMHTAANSHNFYGIFADAWYVFSSI